jgi:NAD-dependent deacetylase
LVSDVTGPGADSILVLTGSGVSADSGLATFRGAGGLWEGRRAEELATPQAWAADPVQVWRFYQMRRAKLTEAEPNAAHHALAELEARLAAAEVPLLLVTQNVDDLHERAGSRPLHMHGELSRLRCERCGHSQRDLEHLDAASFVPCPACAFPRLRPDVVWFGEVPLHLEEIAGACEACSHFLSIGTSGVVYPAAGLLGVARARGERTIVNSLDPPENLHPGDRFAPGRAVDVVPGLVRDLLRELGVA